MIWREIDRYDELSRQCKLLKADVYVVLCELRVAARGADEQGRTDWAIQLRDWADQLEAAIQGLEY